MIENNEDYKKTLKIIEYLSGMFFIVSIGNLILIILNHINVLIIMLNIVGVIFSIMFLYKSDKKRKEQNVK